MGEQRVKSRVSLVVSGWCWCWMGVVLGAPQMLLAGPVCQDDWSEEDQAIVEAAEEFRINAINRVMGSVIAIYDKDRQGGGSGVIIDPSGIALTNHHVIMGAGVEGWGGLADGKLYKWKLIGTDPGGDVSMIQMEGLDKFPFTPLGDSDRVRVGDWALAMGNPFILTEDQAPTVTLGIVSGVKRYQAGAGANQLVYGNCIQVDSSINPGNSGGPLFNFNGEVIGINGRGSFKERGRVNVGLGYAISSNQIKNFIPELLATKLVEHATLDASFSDRKGKVVCSRIHLDSPVAMAGLATGDELLEFEGIPIANANQFTNLICTLPEAWPIQMKIRKKEGGEKTIHVRAFGLPYQKPRVPRNRSGKQPTPQQKKKQERQRQMVALLSATPGEVRNQAVNQRYVQHLIRQWKSQNHGGGAESPGVAKWVGRIGVAGVDRGTQAIWLASDGRFRVEWTLGDTTEIFTFNGDSFYQTVDNESIEMTLVEAKLKLPVIEAMAIASAWQEVPFEAFGDTLLDGSDKAQGELACRLKVTDGDADNFFFWLPWRDQDGETSRQVLKVSAFRDCDEGGVTFRDWQPVGPVSVPFHCDFVANLSESVALTLTAESAEWVAEVDASWFDPVGVNREAGEGASEKGRPDADESIESKKTTDKGER